MVFNKEVGLKILETTPNRLSALIDGLSDDILRYQPHPDHFSILDILGHLIHGEETDWIPRMKIILKGKRGEFEPFDRFGHQNNGDRTSSGLLERFKVLRYNNLKYLRSVDLTLSLGNMTGIHPELGEVNLTQLLNTWVVHDLSHLNQINRILSYYFDEVGPWKTYLRLLNERDIS